MLAKRARPDSISKKCRMPNPTLSSALTLPRTRTAACMTREAAWEGTIAMVAKIADFYARMPKVYGRDECIPKIHESVFGRIKVGAHLYAPIVLPAKYEIVTSTNAVVSYQSGPEPKLEPGSNTIIPNDPILAEGAAAFAREREQKTSGTSFGASVRSISYSVRGSLSVALPAL